MSRAAPTLEAIDAAAARWVARRDAGLNEAEQVPSDRTEQLADETRGQDERQLRLFDLK